MKHKWVRTTHEFWDRPVILVQSHCGKMFMEKDKKTTTKWDYVECLTCLKGKK